MSVCVHACVCVCVCACMRACVCVHVRVCVCVCVCVQAHADPIIWVFVSGVEYGNVRVTEGMYLNIVIIVMCFVASAVLSLVFIVFICT